ncbi:MAG: tRNA preQ1(34) S-adenosylmethionine ribosyltransferase-isomerase QueA [Candidatus Brocadiaceae bacterium]|nr:tRNA preQ1(34) S-adenosylmethionine ribosyltransferase-isomerase QueA [Candidatus Brocadiaceae bacterium]
MYKLSDYTYELPKQLIAQQPLKNRDQAKLLVLYRKTGKIEHRKFYEITEYLFPGDLLILNNTAVIPARMLGNKIHGASVELLFTEELGENQWKGLVKSNARLRNGEKIYLDNNNEYVTLLKRHEVGTWIIEGSRKTNIKTLLHRIGQLPLPPYIKRSRQNATLFSLDKERYQTVFAQKEGAIAAPTAGLHFSEKLLDQIKKQGIDIEFVTLHVGLGTFLPIKTEDIRNHCMHKEYYTCRENLLTKIKKAKARNKAVIATGSTSCRVLETIGINETSTQQLSGFTDLFIYPPYHFQYVDRLITNFHLPKTTLLLLVSAFAGKENILHAYETAKEKGYRFFSYGDCMMIL